MRRAILASGVESARPFVGNFPPLRAVTSRVSRGRIVVGSVIEPLRIDRHLAFMREAPEPLLAMP
jgi:hypothetical protein